MMSTIYGCAIVVIIAMHGKDANCGLAGISASRGIQVTETINGCTLFTTPSTLQWEILRCVWSTRAWTKQEDLLPRRKIHFTSSQVIFSCRGGQVDEDNDIASYDQMQLKRPVLDDYLCSPADFSIFRMVRIKEQLNSKCR